MSHKNVQKVRSDQEKKRPCMKCKRQFTSTWNGHRFCKICRANRDEGIDTVYATSRAL